MTTSLVRRDMPLNVKQAIARARDYLSETFSEEAISDVRLEEVVYDRTSRAWLITFGFMRPSINEGIAAASIFSPRLKRAYKVVSVPENEEDVPAIRIRELAGE